MANNKRFFKTISLAHWHVKLSIAAQLPMVLSFRWEQTCHRPATDLPQADTIFCIFAQALSRKFEVIEDKYELW